MRSITPPLTEVFNTLKAFLGLSVPQPALEALCQVELGLYLQQKMMPGSPAGSAWVLFSGYGFAEAHRAPLPSDPAKTLRIARYSLWTLRRSRTWLEALDTYQRFDPRVRAYDVPDAETPAARRDLSVAGDRFSVYEQLLCAAPPLAGKRLPVAGQGPHAFPVSRTMAVVDLPPVPHIPLIAHDMDLEPAGGGEPLIFTRESLERTAAEMDAQHARSGKGRAPRWLERLRSFDLSTKENGTFHKAKKDEDFAFTVDGIQHLLGIVGAGKSTLRDIIAVHLAKLGKRTTIVVTDVAEVLKLVRLYDLYTDGAAAPVLGSSGRERHAQRLHRRLAGRGEHRLLAHDDPAFAYLGTSCLLNVRRQGATSTTEPLAYGEAPCSRLRPPSARRDPSDGRHSAWQKRVTSCPYWSACPRHHGARTLVGALIWVATPAGLIDASPPRPQNGERIRFLELACRRSDLVIIDEADRVQMQLDQTFAPAVVLASDEDKGLIDQLSRHKIRELAAGGRTQLSERDVETFAAALNTAGAATDRLYAMLVAAYELRKWVRTGYFSAWTLQLGLLDERYELPDDSGPDHPHHAPREALGKLLDAFRDNPFGDRHRRTEEDFSRLTALLNELLHTGNPENTRRRLTEVMDEVFAIDSKYMAARQRKYQEAYDEWRREEEEQEKKRGRRRKPKPPPQTPEEWRKQLAERFEFTLLLSALEPRLAMINAMWPRVEAALSLGFNTMYRRPLDYGPMVPEAPMGNVLGFQFRVPGEDKGGVRSGELTFFRCSGVGRELLRAIPDLTSVDGRPGAHLLLMSGSSWAGASSRYHVCVPVGVVIEPPAEVTERIANASSMRFEFIDDGDEKLRMSGTHPDDRPEKLRRIACHLGEGGDEYEVTEGGPLQQELLSLPPGRDQILLLVGSYAEARVVADTLHNLNVRWRNKVLCLVSDDEEITAEDEAPSAYHARSLRRGDVEHLKDLEADILVAPLLALERGHNILNEDDEAAVGTVYFLARPHPHPEDLHLAVNAVNDWVVRAVTGGDFATLVQGKPTVEEGAEEFRRLARSYWYQVLARSMAWSRLDDDVREQVTWDMLVLLWQVIGRLVRGGVPARVVFVDAAFAPNRGAVPARPDTPESSLLHSVLAILDPYFDGGTTTAEEQFIVRALYAPLRSMLTRLLAAVPAHP